MEEMETCEDKGCSGSPKSMSSKTGSTTKGQAGDGPEFFSERPMTLGNPAIELSAEMELEKVRMEFELTRLKYLHQENERQRQHEEVMEQLQQQARPRLVSDMKVEGTLLVSPEGQGLTPGVREPPSLKPTLPAPEPHPALGPELGAHCFRVSMLN